MRADQESAPWLISTLASKVASLRPSERQASWALLCEKLRRSGNNGRQLKSELKQSAIDGCILEDAAGGLSLAVSRTYMPALIATERNHMNGLTPASKAAYARGGGADAIVSNGSSPWINSVTGLLHPCNLSADIERKKAIGGGLLWQLAQALVKSPNAAKDLLRSHALRSHALFESPLLATDAAPIHALVEGPLLATDAAPIHAIVEGPLLATDAAPLHALVGGPLFTQQLRKSQVNLVHLRFIIRVIIFYNRKSI